MSSCNNTNEENVLLAATKSDENSKNETTSDSEEVRLSQDRMKLVSWSNDTIDSSRKDANSVFTRTAYSKNTIDLKPDTTVVSEDEDNGEEIDDKDDDDDEQHQVLLEDNRIRQQKEAVIYLQTDAERWEMTWPIWHLLPRQERKDIAVKYGYKTIGEFEEHMSFQEASHQMDSSTAAATYPSSSPSITTVPYPNELLYNQSHSTHATTTTKTSTNLAISEVKIVDEEESDDQTKPLKIPNLVKQQSYESLETEDCASQNNNCDGSDESPSLDGSITNGTVIPSQEYLWKLGGLVLLLPEDVYYRIFDFLSVETYAVVALVTPHWKHVTRTERIYKRLCERIYLNQSARASLRVSNFNNSYRTMLEVRPRVRVGGGVYVLKYSQIKRIQRDMWCEIPHGVILESVYYRYLYFQEDGLVLYSLTSAPPHEVFPRLKRICINSNNAKQKESIIQAQNGTSTNSRSSGTNNNCRCSKHQLGGRHHHGNSKINHQNANSTDGNNNHSNLPITGGANAIEASIVWGTYSVQKYTVTVQAKQSWQHVQFSLQIRPEYNSLHGRFGYLSLERHCSSRSGVWDHESCKYSVPTEPFRYIRDRRM
jgi:F-box only protein C-terminal region